MNKNSKTIKYFAMALAIFCIVILFMGIFGALRAIANFFDGRSHTENNETLTKLQTTVFDQEDVLTLDIHLKYSELQIVTGEKFQMQTNNPNITYSKDDQKLKIKEKTDNWLSNYSNTVFILTIPKELYLENVFLSAGAGKVKIENLITENLDFELGAGETYIQYLNVSNQAEMESGAGTLQILDGIIHNLDLDMGIGKVTISASLTGSNEINAGIGELNIHLLGVKTDYLVRVKKGLGSIKVDDQNLIDSKQYGNGSRLVEIDGGIGNIEIHFQ